MPRTVTRMWSAIGPSRRRSPRCGRPARAAPARRASASASVVSHSAELGAGRGHRARPRRGSTSSPTTPAPSAASRAHSAPPMKPPAPVTATRVPERSMARTYTRAPCACREPSASPRGRSSPPASPPRSVRRRRASRGRVVAAAAWSAPVALCVAVPAVARARRRRPACCRCGHTSPCTRCPTTIPRRSRRACTIDYPVRDRPRARARRAARRAAAAALRRPAERSARPRRCSSGRTGSGSLVPARHGRSTCCCAIATQFPRAAALIYATFDLGVIVLLADPDRAAVVRRASTGRIGDEAAGADAAPAPDDARLRRAVLGGPLGARSTMALAGNPLAAMPSLHFATSVMAAHVLAGRGSGRGRHRLGLRGHARLRARVPRASTTSWTCSPASRSPRASRRAGAARGAGCSRARLPRRAGARSAGSCGMTERAAPPSTTPNVPDGGATTTRRCRARGITRRAGGAVRRLRRRGRRVPVLRPAADRRPRRHAGTAIREGDPLWLFACLVFELLSFGGYIWLFRAVFVRGEHADRLARELPDHDGRPGGDAPVRGGRRGRRRADRLGAAPLRHAARDGGVADGRASTCCSTASTCSRS